MKLVPVTPGLLWLLDSAHDPKDFIAGVPDDYESLGTPETDLDLLGFALDSSLRPPVWTLEVGPLKFQVYKVPAYRSRSWRMEVSLHGKAVSTEDYEETYEAQQIPGDVRRTIQNFKSTGLIESVDPKEFMDQAPDVREFIVQQVQKYAEGTPVSGQTNYGFVVKFFIVASIPTVRNLVEQIAAKAGQKMEDVHWNLQPEHQEEKPTRRDVRVVFDRINFDSLY